MQPLVIVADRIAPEGLALLGPDLPGAQPRRAHRWSRPPMTCRGRGADRAQRDAGHAALIDRRAPAPGDRSGRRGVDTIDVAAATARGIVVVNAPGGNAVAAAEHTLALMFALARRIAAADRLMKDGAVGGRSSSAPSWPARRSG